MKNLVLALTVLLSVSSAHAIRPAEYTGKFKIAPGCTSFAGKSAYVGYLRDKLNDTIGLEIAVYGDDAEGMQIYFQDSVRENPNAHMGNPIKTIVRKVTFVGSSVINHTFYVYKNGSRKLGSKVTLSKTAKGLKYSEVSEYDSTTCTLVRQ